LRWDYLRAAPKGAPALDASRELHAAVLSYAWPGVVWVERPMTHALSRAPPNDAGSAATTFVFVVAHPAQPQRQVSRRADCRSDTIVGFRFSQETLYPGFRRRRQQAARGL
jgi:hypothetical protein